MLLTVKYILKNSIVYDIYTNIYYFCWSSFIPDIQVSFWYFSFCLKNILKQIFRCGLWAMNTLSFPLSEYVPMSLSSLKNILLVIYNSFLSARWNRLSLSSLLHGFSWEILNHWIQCSLIGNMSFFSGCFQYFFLDFGCQIYYDMSRYGFLSVYPVSGSLTSICMYTFFTKCAIFGAIISSNIFSTTFFHKISLNVQRFVNFPQFLEALYNFSKFLSSLLLNHPVRFVSFFHLLYFSVLIIPYLFKITSLALLRLSTFPSISRAFTIALWNTCIVTTIKSLQYHPNISIMVVYAWSSLSMWAEIFLVLHMLDNFQL